MAPNHHSPDFGPVSALALLSWAIEGESGFREVPDVGAEDAPWLWGLKKGLPTRGGVPATKLGHETLALGRCRAILESKAAPGLYFCSFCAPPHRAAAPLSRDPPCHLASGFESYQRRAARYGLRGQPLQGKQTACFAVGLPPPGGRRGRAAALPAGSLSGRISHCPAQAGTAAEPPAALLTSAACPLLQTQEEVELEQEAKLLEKYGGLPSKKHHMLAKV